MSKKKTKVPKKATGEKSKKPAQEKPILETAQERPPEAAPETAAKQPESKYSKSSKYKSRDRDRGKAAPDRPDESPVEPAKADESNKEMSEAPSDTGGQKSEEPESKSISEEPASKSEESRSEELESKLESKLEFQKEEPESRQEEPKSEKEHPALEADKLEETAVDERKSEAEPSQRETGEELHAPPEGKSDNQEEFLDLSDKDQPEESEAEPSKPDSGAGEKKPPATKSWINKLWANKKSEEPAESPKAETADSETKSAVEAEPGDDDYQPHFFESSTRKSMTESPFKSILASARAAKSSQGRSDGVLQKAEQANFEHEREIETTRERETQKEEAPGDSVIEAAPAAEASPQDDPAHSDEFRHKNRSGEPEHAGYRVDSKQEWHRFDGPGVSRTTPVQPPQPQQQPTSTRNLAEPPTHPEYRPDPDATRAREKSPPEPSQSKPKPVDPQQELKQRQERFERASLQVREDKPPPVKPQSNWPPQQQQQSQAENPFLKKTNRPFTSEWRGPDQSHQAPAAKSEPQSKPAPASPQAHGPGASNIQSDVGSTASTPPSGLQRSDRSERSDRPVTTEWHPFEPSPETPQKSGSPQPESQTGAQPAHPFESAERAHRPITAEWRPFEPNQAPQIPSQPSPPPPPEAPPSAPPAPAMPPAPASIEPVTPVPIPVPASIEPVVPPPTPAAGAPPYAPPERSAQQELESRKEPPSVRKDEETEQPWRFPDLGVPESPVEVDETLQQKESVPEPVQNVAPAPFPSIDFSKQAVPPPWQPTRQPGSSSQPESFGGQQPAAPTMPAFEAPRAGGETAQNAAQPPGQSTNPNEPMPAWHSVVASWAQASQGPGPAQSPPTPVAPPVPIASSPIPDTPSPPSPQPQRGANQAPPAPQLESPAAVQPNAEQAAQSDVSSGHRLEMFQAEFTKTTRFKDKLAALDQEMQGPENAASESAPAPNSAYQAPQTQAPNIGGSAPGTASDTNQQAAATSIDQPALTDSDVNWSKDRLKGKISKLVQELKENIPAEERARDEQKAQQAQLGERAREIAEDQMARTEQEMPAIPPEMQITEPRQELKGKISKFAEDLRGAIEADRRTEKETWRPLEPPAKEQPSTAGALHEAIEALKSIGNKPGPVPQRPAVQEHFNFAQELASLASEAEASWGGQAQEQHLGIRRLKTAGRLRFDIYLGVLFICFILAFAAEKTLPQTTLDILADTGKRVKVAVAKLGPDQTGSTFFGDMARAFEQEENRLVPHKPNTPKPQLTSRGFLICTSAAFAALPSGYLHALTQPYTVLSTLPGSADSLLYAQILLAFIYCAAIVISTLVFLRFNRLPGPSGKLTMVIYWAVVGSLACWILSFMLTASDAICRGVMPDTCVVFVVLAFCLCAIDLTMRNFMRKKSKGGGRM